MKQNPSLIPTKTRFHSTDAQGRQKTQENVVLFLNNYHFVPKPSLETEEVDVCPPRDHQAPSYLPLLEEADQILVVPGPQGQVVNEQQHAEGVLIRLETSRGNAGSTEKENRALSVREWAGGRAGSRAKDSHC